MLAYGYGAPRTSGGPAPVGSFPGIPGTSAAPGPARGERRAPESRGQPPGGMERQWYVGQAVAALSIWSPETGSGAVSRATNRRDEQIGALYDAHFPGLCRLATLLLGGDAGAAEEAVQEAFVQTYIGWWRVRDPARADAYVRRAVVNQCRSRLRRRGSEERANRRTWMAGGLDRERCPAGEVPGPQLADEPSRHAQHSDDTARVLAAVRALPERQRAAVVLRYYQDLSDAQIAATLGCSLGTVKSQLSKARAHLGRLLDDSGPGSTGSTGSSGGEP